MSPFHPDGPKGRLHYLEITHSALGCTFHHLYHQVISSVLTLMFLGSSWTSLYENGVKTCGFSRAAMKTENTEAEVGEGWRYSPANRCSSTSGCECLRMGPLYVSDGKGMINQQKSRRN